MKIYPAAVGVSGILAAFVQVNFTFQKMSNVLHEIFILFVNPDDRLMKIEPAAVFVSDILAAFAEVNFLF